jgi:glycogen debranching enzyme
MSDTISILDGNQFVVSNRQGDMEATPTVNHGLFLNDTRYLSRWVMTINGIRPVVLTVDETAYYRVQHFLALATGTTYIDSNVTVVRRRSIGEGFREHLVIGNHGREPIDFNIRIEVGADFADLFEVKDKLAKKGELYREIDGGRLTLGYRRDQFRRETHITCTAAAEVDEDGLSIAIRVGPGVLWSTDFDVVPAREYEASSAALMARQASPDLTGVRVGAVTFSEDSFRQDLTENLRQWIDAAPKATCAWEPLRRIYRRSLVDLGALRFRAPVILAEMPAAGLPWFMAIFGRDSLITSFQALPFLPELASTTLKTLAMLQSRADDAFRDAEPGKIAHELRFGELTAFEDTPHSPYYGTADATPLFLILMEEYERWTGDRDLVRSLESQARAAVRWIDHHGDRDGDGYIEYERRNPKGLENQCWKDSWDSIAFADGTLAETPRATCELQGYAYDAKRRAARLAREVWNDPAWAAELDAQAAELKRRFNEDFWLPKQGFFALGLDGRKRKIDSLTSNIGHLLWSGIADEDKAKSCVAHLMSDALFSGWGVRTMARTERSYNPIGYHVGTVWPHDNSIIAWGLNHYGYKAEAGRISYAMLEAAELFGGRLPEAFAGYARETTNYPVEYPTACSPQAWASGAPLLLIRAMLGLEAKDGDLVANPAVPDEIGRLELLDVAGAWGKRDVFGRSRLQTEAWSRQ